jgi:hypothetical protein
LFHGWATWESGRKSDYVTEGDTDFINCPRLRLGLSVAIILGVVSCGPFDGDSAEPATSSPPTVLAAPKWELRQVNCSAFARAVSCWDIEVVAPGGCPFGLQVEVTIRKGNGSEYADANSVDREIAPNAPVRFHFVFPRDRDDHAEHPREDFTARVTNLNCY